LSTWLRDYLYIPLGGNRGGTVRTYRNLMLTMLLGGLWHGASWNFVIWGGIHGGCLAAERAAGESRRAIRVPRIVRVFATFVVVIIAWVFFRAPSLGRAESYIGNLAGLGSPDARELIVTASVYQPYYLVSVALAAIVVWMCRQAWDVTRVISWPRAAFCAAVFCLALASMFTQSYNPFIYYIF
jgi:alginate O-acetyltransferase complex protein AlgI